MYPTVKRASDVAVSVVAIIVTFPVMLVIAGLVAANLGRPVLFVQQRPGLHGEPFLLLKFRTMRQPTSAHRTDEERLTPFGRWLRSTSLDELPSLWNVARGDMSLVGPRPLLMQYLPLYNAEQARRHDVRPGLTGLAQVRGRNSLSWTEKFALDIQYVDTYSLGLDLRILAETIGVVMRRSGITAGGDATMPPFEGNSEDP
jgi:lipopolysaccharide/colanic/teichoic acid biosynthesis glycosyltransferase